MDIIGYITKLQANVFHIRNDDDFADRLNYRYTVAILIAFAIIVTNRQFSESVIKCWVPAYFTQNYEAYANQVCWVSNTYYANQTQNLAKTEEQRKESEIKYYQWIPFILLIQALFLYIPRIIWRMLSTRAGIELKDIIEAAHSYKSVEKYDIKCKMTEYMVDNIDRYLSNQRRLKKRDKFRQRVKYYFDSFCCGAGIYLGNYLVTTYIFTKILYIGNSCLQFFLMNEFLGKQFHELGIAIFKYISTGQSIHSMLESVYFPKVVMCDFRIREFGHPNFSHRYSIQCVLPINLYNQQIFTFLWFWFIILMFANVYALVSWAFVLLPKQRKIYIKKRLKLLNKYQRLLYNKDDPSLKEAIQRTLKDFNEIYLKCDGVFIIKLISILASDMVGTQVLHELWKRRKNYNRAVSSCIESHSSKDENNRYKGGGGGGGGGGGDDERTNIATVSTVNDKTDFIKQNIVEESEADDETDEENEIKTTLIDTAHVLQPSSLLNARRNLIHDTHQQQYLQQPQQPSQRENIISPTTSRPTLQQPYKVKKAVAFAPTYKAYLNDYNTEVPLKNDEHAYNHKANYPYIDQNLKDDKI